MKKHLLRVLALSGLLAFTSPAWSQGWFGGGGKAPSLTLAPAEIALDVPTPARGRDLELLLAGAGEGGSLSELKAQAERKFSALLERELNARLREHFDDEEVPVVEERGFLTLYNFLDIAVGRQLIDLKTSGDYELERGTLKLVGDFHYRLENTSGASLRERRLDITELQVQEKYRIKTPLGDGEVEDSSDRAIEKALSRLAQRLLDNIENDLEADELRELAAL